MQSAPTKSTQWLAAHLNDPMVRIVDASWYLPAMNRDGKAEYNQRHIYGALYFDIDAISDRTSPLPHTLASPQQFAEQIGALGISQDHTIVVYDGMGLFSAARAWWNFKIMGAENTFLLDGGLPKWRAEERPLHGHETANTAASPFPPCSFKTSFKADALVSFEEMIGQVINDDTIQVIDARPHGRFTGEDKEPRAGMRSGHMPGAFSVPASSLSVQGQLHPVEKLRDIFIQAGVDLQKPIVTTCGSGVTAATLIAALTALGHKDHKLYDGSWAQWGARADTPIVT